MLWLLTGDVEPMTKLEKIEREVEALTPDELARFREWFVEYDAMVWDAQIEADAKAGRLDKFIAKAKADIAAGKTRLL